jgi:hypothetical protein
VSIDSYVVDGDTPFSKSHRIIHLNIILYLGGGNVEGMKVGEKIVESEIFFYSSV